MKKEAIILTIILFSGAILSVQAQSNKKDYFHIQQPIKFNDKEYYFNNSNKQDSGYYKQEYTLKKEENTHFIQDMLTIDLFIFPVSPDSITKEIKKRITSETSEDEMLKKTGNLRFVQYKVYEHPEKKECVLELITSKEDTQDKPKDVCCDEIMDWKICMYKAYKDKSGKTGIIAFSYISRFILGRLNNRNNFIEQQKSKQSEYIYRYRHLGRNVNPLITSGLGHF